MEVYFDDFKVEHVKSPIIESSDYYPFGLTFNNYRRENSLSNQVKFQGQEHQDELDLGWDSFKWRNHQPDIGRFFNVDPLAEKYYHNSTYAFSGNNVISHRELEGLEPYPINPMYYSTPNASNRFMADGFRQYFAGGGRLLDKIQASITETTSTIINKISVNLGVGKAEVTTTSDVTTTTTVGTTLEEFFDNANPNGRLFKVETETKATTNETVDVQAHVFSATETTSTEEKNGEPSKTSEMGVSRYGNGAFISTTKDSKGSRTDVGIQATLSTTDKKTTTTTNLKLFVTVDEQKKK